MWHGRLVSVVVVVVVVAVAAAGVDTSAAGLFPPPDLFAGGC